MTLQARDSLVKHITETNPALRDFVRELPTDLTANSLDLVSCSFERGFEAMWDLALADRSGLLQRPLLVLWRQSVELAIKSTFFATMGEKRTGHDLNDLFAQLLSARSKAGYGDGDDHARNVKAMIDQVQSFDPFADRFRYPDKRDGQPYMGFSLDLEELFQAHWIITTWCQFSSMQAKGEV